MRMVQQSLVNITNRSSNVQGYNKIFGSYISEPKIIVHPSHKIETQTAKSNHHPKQYAKLIQQKARLELQISEATEEHSIMMDLCQSILKLQKGELELERKRQRRNASDILIKYQCKYQNCKKSYSSEDCLNRHMKVKHSCSKSKSKPPELYYDLHPEPNLTDIYFSSSEEQIADPINKSYCNKIPENMKKCSIMAKEAQE